MGSFGTGDRVPAAIADAEGAGGSKAGAKARSSNAQNRDRPNAIQPRKCCRLCAMTEVTLTVTSGSKVRVLDGPPITMGVPRHREYPSAFSLPALKTGRTGFSAAQTTDQISEGRHSGACSAGLWASGVTVLSP
jgi:hypothetical protein